MIDIKTEILALLKEVCPEIKVTYSRPKEVKTIPLVTYVEENNSEYNDFIDEITLSIDIWESTQLKCEKIATKINEAMREKGFKRVSKIPLPEGNINRINLRYYGLIDENKFVSKGEY